MEKIKHIYVFYIKEGNYYYDRTCKTIERAEELTSNLKKLYDDAEYFIDQLPEVFFS